MNHELNELFDAALRDVTRQLLPIARNAYLQGRVNGNPADSNTVPGPVTRRQGHVFYQLKSVKGKIVARSEGAPAEPLPIALRKGFTSKGNYRYYTLFVNEQKQWIQVAQDLEERREAEMGLWLGLFVPLLVLLPIAALAVITTVAKATAPIGQIRQQLASRWQENLEPISESGLPRELAPVIVSVNELLKRLKAAIETERSYAANAAHELRNPIASARAQAQVLAEKLRESADYVRAANIASTLGTLGRQIERLLEYSRVEAGVGLARDKTDLAAIAEIMAADIARRPDAGRISVHVPDNGGSLVAIDQDALAIVLRNAIENAIVHGALREPIDVIVGSDHSVRVINTGPPVASEQLGSLKGRFQRGRSAAGSGTGLGLAIIDTIMRQADGSMELFSPAHGRSDGFEIVLRFPAFQAETILAPVRD